MLAKLIAHKFQELFNDLDIYPEVDQEALEIYNEMVEDATEKLSKLIDRK